jgi:hypothetical protein
MADEKKLIIDEDWKSQVAAEKRQAQTQSAAKPAEGGASSASEAPGPADLKDVPMPPASLELLLTMLGTEALTAMGHLPHPATGKVHVHHGQAKYLIDTIDVLREKTKGNLTADEQELLEGILHQLRMAFVATSK